MAGGKLQAGKDFEVEMELSTHRRPGSAFLEKLYDILEDERYEEYISWCSDGTSILIKKVEEFSQIVLPRYYKHNNFQSFVRQLNMYNFTKTSHDANWREFKQPLFRKNKRDLLPLIMRKTQTTNNSSKDTSEKRSRQDTASGSCGSDEDKLSEVADLKLRVAHLEELFYTLCQCPNMPANIKDMCFAYIKPPQAVSAPSVSTNRIYRQYSEDQCRNKKHLHTITKSNMLRHTTSLESYVAPQVQSSSVGEHPMKRQRPSDKPDATTSVSDVSHRACTEGVDAILSAAQLLTRKSSKPDGSPATHPTTNGGNYTTQSCTEENCQVVNQSEIDEDSYGKTLCRQNSCFKNE